MLPFHQRFGLSRPPRGTGARSRALEGPRPLLDVGDRPLPQLAADPRLEALSHAPPENGASDGRCGRHDREKSVTAGACELFARADGRKEDREPATSVLDLNQGAKGDGLVLFQPAGTEAVQGCELRARSGGALRLPLGKTLELERRACVLALLRRCSPLASLLLRGVAGLLGHAESLAQALDELSDKGLLVHVGTTVERDECRRQAREADLLPGPEVLGVDLLPQALVPSDRLPGPTTQEIANVWKEQSIPLVRH